MKKKIVFVSLPSVFNGKDYNEGGKNAHETLLKFSLDFTKMRTALAVSQGDTSSSGVRLT